MSGNQASDGAGIEAFEGARVTVSSSTIADNTATGSGGGLRIDPGGRVTASNTLVGDNAVVPRPCEGNSGRSRPELLLWLSHAHSALPPLPSR